MTTSDYTSVEAIPGIVSALRKTFDSGKTKDVNWRQDQLKSLAYLLQDNEKALSEAIRKDLGRTPNETFVVEIVGVLNDVIEAVKNVKKWARPEKVSTEFKFKIFGPKIYKEPKGVALIIGTWNYPVSLLLQPLVGAIAAGCPAVVKCSEVAPNVAKILAELVPKYLDSTAYTVVTGELDIAKRLLEEQWGHLFYTGNSKVARSIAAAAAKTLTPISLELGGKSPVIIDPELKDLDIVAKRILWAKRLNSGQTCIAPDYILVSNEQQGALVSALEKQHRLLFPTGNLSQDDFPPIVSDGHFGRLEAALSKTRGSVITGTEKDKSKRQLGLSLVRDVTWEDELMKDELFGPILPIVPVANMQEAVDHLRGATPLVLYIFSQQKKFTSWIRENTASGAIVVNDLLLQFVVDALPFGGVGESGQGNYHGKRSFDTFTHERSYLTNPFWADFLLGDRYYPHTDQKIAKYRSMNKRINFARPGTQIPTFAAGGQPRRLLVLAFQAVLLAVVASRWSWIMSILPKYRLVRVQ